MKSFDGENYISFVKFRKPTGKSVVKKEPENKRSSQSKTKALHIRSARAAKRNW